MHALLFRKMNIDGVNYYQLYGEKEDFTPDSSFADYKNRATKEFFYVNLDNDKNMPFFSLYDIYYDDKKGVFKQVNEPKIFDKVSNEFKNYYSYSVGNVKPINKIVDNVEEKILFQREAIGDLVSQIYVNRGIILSNLPVELKLKLKNNILFHGAFGSGKKSIIECLEKELNIPYADVTISTNLKDTLEDIIKQLLSRSNSPEEASNGIVFIRDNFINLMEVLGDNVYSAPSFFTDKGPIEYNGKIIDFRTLTFVILFDERADLEFENIDIDSIMTMADCSFIISTRNLTDDEKYQVLFSKYGRITLYEKFLKDYNHKIIVDENSLRKIIKECSKVDPGMNVLNTIIDGLMKENLLFGISDVHIDDRAANAYLPIIYSFMETNYPNEHSKEENNSEENNQAFDDELEKIANIITKDVIGQDKQVKSILYTILENRRMINKTDIDDPKKYRTNLLIRGESGSGKTMIIEKISKLLNIPTFIADSTQYTETGWAGESVTDMLVGLYNAAGGDLEAAEKGILFIDEVDKKATTDSHGGPSRGAVLDNLLKSIEGSKVSINVGSRGQEEKILFDTTRLTVICSGAFENIEEYRDKRLGRRKPGFEREIRSDVDQNITIDDYLTYGMNKQFMSRFSKIVELNKSTKESLIKVMKESESSKLKIEKYKLEDRGIEVEYTEDFYEGLAEVALKRKTGVRGIEQALTKVLDSINIEDIKASEVSKIILTKDVISDPSKVILIERSKVKKKTR